MQRGDSSDPAAIDITRSWTWSATDTAQRVRAGEVQALDVITAHLARLDAVGPALNAVTRRNDDAALARAAALDADRAAGRALGPLAGVAVTIKDSVDVAGQSSPNGVAALDGRIATSDAPVVQHLQDAGAIVIGRTNAPEFSWRWHTDNPLFGPTRNPWNPRLTPGGSSGGAAAALAAGVGALAQGSDAGGSLRWPASCCGISTIRPTQHRVAMHNSTADTERSPAIDLMAVAGPMARTVADVALMLEVMVRPSWRDPAQVPVPFVRSGPLRPAGHPVRGTTLTVGIPDPPLAVQAPVADALDEATRRLVDAGWQRRAVRLPPLEESAQLWAVLLNSDFHHTVRQRFLELGSAELALMLDVLDGAGPVTDLDGYLRALARRATLVRQWQQLLHEDVDIVMLPVCREPTWPAGDDCSSRSRLEELFTANEPLVAINFLGLPAAAQPVARYGGAPLAVQLVAARFEEPVALAAAAAIEAAGPIDYESLWSAPW